MRQADWVDIADALRIMLEHVSQTGPESVDLDDVAGRTLASPVISPIDHPPWDNSAMDGFAAHAADVRDASAAQPVRLTVVDEIAAGGFPARPVGRGEAARIMTGAPVPGGADSVVRVEHTRPGPDGTVDVLDGADAGRNIRLQAEDLRAGQSVLTSGRLIRAAEAGILAMVGCTRPVVAQRPQVAVLANGNELVDAHRLDAAMAGTHIINSNTPALAAALRATGCSVLDLGIARDDATDLRARIRDALDADALITTAGASVGDHDLVKDVLEDLGCTTHFWRVRIRPGSPFSFGTIMRPGRPALPVFGLPGNPVSVLVTYEILVRPVLRRMLGRRAIYPPVLRARAGEDIGAPAGLVRFLRVRLEATESDMPLAYLTGPQGSGILTSVAAADALLVLPLQQSELREGDVARVVPLGSGDDAIDTLQLDEHGAAHGG